MSLISGLYYRGDPKQKPKQWGPACAVKNSIINYFNNRIGVKAPNLMVFGWEGAGKAMSVISNNIQATPGIGCYYDNYSLRNDSTIFGETASWVIPHDSFTVNGWSRFSSLSRAKFISSSSHEACIYRASGTAGQGISFGVYQSTNKIRPLISTTGTTGWSISYDVVLPSGIATNKSYNYGLTYKSGERKTFFGYKNAELIDTKTAITGNITYTASHNMCLLGSAYAISVTAFPGTLDYLIIANTIYSDSIIHELSENPYSAIQPPTFRAYFDLSAQSLLSITDTPDLTDIISYPILGSETATGLDSGSSPDVISSPLPGIDSCTALDMACIANATGLGINAFDQTLAFDSPAFATASGVPIECILGNILYDAAQLSNAVGVITQAHGIVIANDICSVTPISASALINAGYAVAVDYSVLVVDQGAVIPGGEIGLSTDVSVLAQASATAIAVMLGNSMLDAAMLAQAGVVVLAAGETAIANGYGAMTAVPSVVLVSDEQASAVDASVMAGVTGWVIQGVEVMSVADYAALAASQGLAVSAFETLVLTDPSAITLVNAWILTAATATDHDINAIFGTPVLVPVMSGRPVLQNKLQGTPLIIRS